MKNNLEDISFNEVANVDGKSYAEFREELHPDYIAVKRDIFKGYACLVLILILAILLSRSGLFKWFLMLPGALLAGYCLAYLHLFIHEAAHYNLHPDRTKNDWISDLMIGVFFGIPVKNYRKIHWLHHQHLGTTNDSEHSYYNALNLFFLLKSITGIQAILVIIERAKKSDGNKRPKTSILYLGYLVFFHSALLLILFISGGWMVVSMWLIALISVFPFLAALRQLLEHRDINASGKSNFTKTDHGKISRLFGDNFIDSSFGAAGFNKHLIHHWDPVISYTRLKEVEAFLSDCPSTSENIRQSKTGYVKIFVSLFKFD
ncbi:MAG TPA: fatty acid desaturase [Puia sp.]|nr:fatty acid desaturase [Puia sp.]